MFIFRERCDDVAPYDPVTKQFLPGHDHGLTYLLNHFTTEFSPLVQTAEVELEAWRERQGLSDWSTQQLEQLRRMRAEFSGLTERVRRVTLGQLKLQHHFQHFVHFEIGYLVDNEERAVFFAPLITLREQYFSSPRNGLLAKYLDTAQTLLESPRYYLPTASKDPLQRQRHQQTLESCAAEIEVLSMLETR
jgi:hypothetical protein